MTADPTRCPLCANVNECGAAQGASTCWCFETSVPSTVLAKVPDEAKGVACVCRGCAKGRPAITPSGFLDAVKPWR